MVEKNLEVGDSSPVASFSSHKSVQNSLQTKPTEGTNEDDNSILEKTVCPSSETPMHQELPASLILIDNKSNLREILVEQKVDNIGLPSIKEDSHSFPSASNEDDESKEAINDTNSNLQEISVQQKAPNGGSLTGSSEVDNSGLLSMQEDSPSFSCASNEVDESKEVFRYNKSNLQETLVEQKASVGGSITGSSEVDKIGLPSIKEDYHGFPSASDEDDESKEAIKDNNSNLQEIFVEQKAPVGRSITGSSEVDSSGLPSIKEDSHSFPSASNEVDESKEAINDNKSNLQEVLVEQKAPTGGSITGSLEVDNSVLPSIKEDSHSFPSASNKVDESKEAIKNLMAMQSSGENTHAKSQTSVSSIEDARCTPLNNVPDAACSDSEKTACEAAPAILACFLLFVTLILSATTWYIIFHLKKKTF